MIKKIYRNIRHMIVANFVRLAFMLFLFFFSPILIINVIDYRRNIKKNPLYKSKLVKFCEKYPFVYNVFMFISSFPLSKNIYRILPDVSGKVLQVGCGTGLLNKYYIQNKKLNKIVEMVNLDVNINFLKYGLRKKIFQSYLHANIYSVPIEDNFFDVIIFARCFHHIRSHKKAFRECSRLLRKKGVIIIVDPVSLSINENVDSYMTNTDFDGVVWRFSKNAFKKNIEENLTPDLKLITIDYIRQVHLTNYNLIYPHTDGLVTIEKS